ncbi:hypothetical protein GOP47_0015557 [Adiantum capillus-veneris]|uniref:Heterokaryon incompatibility domain-containing protein n=1 Tax=Adiantum capillus-veneris TaxID=13818 RepID=A0A9D4UKT7_ADICA|nr:hypothetical protein GOP47_0015557 [Adiantum capillus-veneris]
MDNYSFNAWSADREQEIKNGCWYQILPATLLFQEVVQGSFKRVKARHSYEAAWYEEVLYFDKSATMLIFLWPFKFHPVTNYRLFLRVLFGPVSPTSSLPPTLDFELKPGLATPSSSHMDEWRTSHSSILLHSIEFSIPFSVDAVVLSPQTKPHYVLPPPSKPLSSIFDDVKPLRLIDIEKTLCSNGGVVFKQAQSWDFHVISHTWSEDVRAFSKTIADINEQSGFTSSYEELFKEGDFSAQPAYKSMMEFFKILQSDNVKDVWFDALCINQRDDEEKGKEIAHMGAYYKHSKACYVVKHGIGKGYKLATRLKGGGFGIARWFSRAWTFQEYVLPHRMIFLTECIPKRVQRMVNHCISSTSHSMVCRCSLSELEQKLLSVLHNLQFFDPNAEVGNDMIGSDIDVPCDKCGELSFIRKMTT